MHAILSYCGNRHRPPARCKPTDRTDNNYTGPLSLARSVTK